MPPGKPAPKRRKPFFISRLEELCSSDDLSIDELRRITDDITFASSNHYGISLDSSDNRQYHKSTFLHRLCLNKNVTLEIVELLLTLFPTAFGFNMAVPSEYVISAYPLHLACYNEDCPNEVILLLLEKSGDYQLTRISDMDFDYVNSDIIMDEDEYYGGVPLHFYLSRTSNVDLDIVKELIDTPETLLLTDEDTKCTPIHILLHNRSVGDMFDVVKYLSELNPSSLNAKDLHDAVPLHIACKNEGITPSMIKLLLRVWPECAHQQNHYLALPLHILCMDERDEEVAIDILKLLLKAHPGSVSETDDEGHLPLHFAAYNKSSAFCKVLVDAYPELVKRLNGDGELPFHLACDHGRLETVEYLFGLYPESLHIRDNREELRGRNQELLAFLSTQLNYARQAQEVNFMRTVDRAGSLPLHKAVRDNAPLGSVKLLVKGNPDAVNVPNGSGMCPLDIAIQYSKVDIVEYLAVLSPDRLNACDVNKNFPLHHACRGGNCEVISYLLKTPLSSASVSERNVDDKLPIHLFCEFVNRFEEEEDAPEYTETIWRLLTAYPETVLNW